MGSILEAAEQLAELLQAVGIRATSDPGWAASNRPCVLVPPPRIDYRARRNEWTLAALSSQDTGGLPALAELDRLVQAVLEALPVESADPASYPLTDTGPVPAYLLRLTT